MPYVRLSKACDIRASTHHCLMLCDGGFFSQEHFNSGGPTSNYTLSRVAEAREDSFKGGERRRPRALHICASVIGRCGSPRGAAGGGASSLGAVRPFAVSRYPSPLFVRLRACGSQRSGPSVGGKVVWVHLQFSARGIRDTRAGSLPPALPYYFFMP